MAWIRMTGGDNKSLKYIYKDGSFNPVYFSGLEGKAYGPSGTAGFAYYGNIISNVSNQVSITNDNDVACGSAFSSKAFNVTNLNAININVIGYNASYTKYNPSVPSIEIILTNSATQNYTKVKSVSVNANGTFSLDVSDLTGEYYLAFFLKTYTEQGRIVFNEISCT